MLHRLRCLTKSMRKTNIQSAQFHLEIYFNDFPKWNEQIQNKYLCCFVHSLVIRTGELWCFWLLVYCLQQSTINDQIVLWSDLVFGYSFLTHSLSALMNSNRRILFTLSKWNGKWNEVDEWNCKKTNEAIKSKNKMKILTNDEIRFSVAWQQQLIRWFVYLMHNNHLIMNLFGFHWSIDQYPFCLWYLDQFRPHRIHHRIVIGVIWMNVLTAMDEVFVIFVANNWQCQWYLIFLRYTFWNSSLDVLF